MPPHPPSRGGAGGRRPSLPPADGPLIMSEPQLPASGRERERGARATMRETTRDRWLMRRIRNGDEGAFERFYDRHARRMHAVAWAICREQAEEAVQHAFLDLWRRRDRFDDRRCAPVTWLLSLVRHRALDTVRREINQRRRVERLRGEPARPASARAADELAERRASRAAIHDALLVLTAKQREAIVICFYGGLSHREAARLLELPVGTVKSRIRAGLERLCMRLEDSKADLEPHERSDPALTAYSGSESPFRGDRTTYDAVRRSG